MRTSDLPTCRVFFLTLSLLIIASHLELAAQRLSRDLNVDLLINQAGYLPHAHKSCVVKGKINQTFDVIDLKTQDVVYTGSLQYRQGDLGDFSVGDFSAVQREGAYYLRSDTLRSYPFSIYRDVYQSPMSLIVQYFSRQRCGSSTSGYLSPCHLDDGVRIDNGKHQDVTGGWHDASDLRKWVGATIYGIIGLARTYELQDGNPGIRDRILEELMWGNRYFLNMQEPAGYVMSFVGGDVKKHSDSNRWTDNEVGQEGGELKMVRPTTGKSSAETLVFGSNDDRVIQTEPLDITGQYNFITAEAMMARVTRSIDAEYSQKCLQAAIKCFDWCRKTNKEITPGLLGAALHASVEMYKATRQPVYLNFAVEQASKLRTLQVTAQDGPGGFFKTSVSNATPFKDIWHGCLEFISLCDLIEASPQHRDVALWKEVIAQYSEQYLLFMSQRNNFGIVPFGLYSSEDPGGNRKVGNYWYRYFMQPLPDWWVGINSNLASAGVGLIKASKVLNEPNLKSLAQRQLDWIIGVNPFNSSTVVGVGYNHPKHFPGSTFYPLTPVLPGAVLNGLGGDEMDQAVIGNGHWQISEYWTPMVAYTLWLMAELSEPE